VTCLLCGGGLSEPRDVAAGKPWWPPMGRCSSAGCPARGVYVADPAEVERLARETPDATEPKLAYSTGGDWYVSTIYRRSSAGLYEGRYYETMAFVRVEDGYRVVYEHGGSASARGALRAHAVFSRRLARAGRREAAVA
jgi:hypothetical protein